jgi:hypothetical protein
MKTLAFVITWLWLSVTWVSAQTSTPPKSIDNQKTTSETKKPKPERPPREIHDGSFFPKQNTHLIRFQNNHWTRQELYKLPQRFTLHR